jgi:iron-sulfur cluster assembly accessory protein
MVAITDKAAEEMKTVLKDQEKEDHGIRIFIAGMGCGGPNYGLAFEKEPKEEDKTEEVSGIKFVMDSAISEYMDGATVDFVETPQGSGFVVNSPKAAQMAGGGCSSCGPGDNCG